MKLKPLSNEEKIKVYKAALRHFKKDRVPFSMCYSISKTYDKIYKTHNAICVNGTSDAYAKLRRMFPEFEALRPAEKVINGFWWPYDVYDYRIEMFNKLIKDLEAKISSCEEG